MKPPSGPATGGRLRGPRLLALLLAVLGAAAVALAQAPTARDYYEAGLRHKNDKEFAAAAEDFRAAVKADPAFADAFWGLGWVYVGLGREEDAIEAFRAVIRLAPDGENSIEAAKAIERIRLRRPELDLPPPEPETFLAAVVLTRAGRTDLWLADSSGTLRRRVTDDLAVESQPSFAPDGRRLVFTSNRTGKRHLWLVKADGRDLRRLTDGDWEDYSPAWAPRAEEIAFVSDRAGRPELFLLDLQGAAATSLGQVSAEDLSPCWSPDGQSLAFVSDREGVSRLYVWRRDTREVRPVLANAVAQYHPVWGLDSRSLYFAWRLEGHWQICRVGLTGEGLEAVRPSPDNDTLWGLSPEGGWLLVSSDRTGEVQWYLSRVESSEVRMLGPGEGRLSFATLSPALPESVARLLLEARSGMG